MTPIDVLLEELEGYVEEALSTVDWIDGHCDDDVQFLRHRLKSVLHEVRYLQAERIPA